MTRVSRDLLARVDGVIQAWEKLSPKKKFSGFTVAQLKEVVGRCRDVRAEIKEQGNNLRGAQRRRALCEAELTEMERRVVLAVRSDDEFGEDSDLFGQMGFVPRSQRARRARRRSSAVAGAVGKKPEVAASTASMGVVASASAPPMTATS